MGLFNFFKKDKKTKEILQIPTISNTVSASAKKTTSSVSDTTADDKEIAQNN